MLSPERDTKLKDVARQRQYDLTVILENVHDPHNIGAVMRTCDSVGIDEIYALYTTEGNNSVEEYVGKRSSKGTKKWVKCHFFHDMNECIQTVRKKYKKVYATHLSEGAISIYKTDLTLPTAIIFGNERDGVSKELLRLCDGNMLIPMVGMVQSLNISVAAAVTIYEAFRQRTIKEMYERPFDMDNKQMKQLYHDGVAITYPRIFESDPTLIDKVVEQKGHE